MRHPHPLAEPVRHGAATALLGLGAVLVGQLWYQPLSSAALLLAANGLAYLLLSLGLFGTSRLSLLLGAVLLTARAAEGWPPTAPELAQWWEMVRTALELLVAAACAGVYWMLRRRTPG